jgi:hypothetical protein
MLRPMHSRTTTEGNQPMTLRDLFQQARPTDHPLLTPLRVCSSPAEARVAALQSVVTTCECGQSWRTSGNIPDHRCVDHAGRDLSEMKRVRAAGARRALRQLQNYPAPPCAQCGADMPPGVVHECQVALAMLPHEESALRWQRKGTAAALANDLADIQGDPR